MFTESLVQNNLIKQEIEKISAESFRTKYEATFRAQDGHMVRSRSELLIDNYLYQYGIIHAYEKQIALDDGEMYCDFYIPTKKSILNIGDWKIIRNMLRGKILN